MKNLTDKDFLNILRDLPDALLLIDAHCKIFYANPQAIQLFGEMDKIIDLIPKMSSLQRKTRLLQHWRTLEKEGNIESFETQLLDKVGNLIAVDVNETAIFNEFGKMRAFSAIIKDVTETKESEQRITRRNRQLFALIDVADGITQNTETETLLKTTLDAVLRVTSLDAGCVHLFDEEDESLILRIEQNLAPDAIQMINRFELGEGIIGQSAVLGETLIVSDTSNDRRLSRNISSIKIGSLAAIPLVGQKENLLGVTTLFNIEPRVFSEHETSMLTAIGKQVGVALERINLFREVTFSRQEWEETFDSMTDGVSIHAPSGKIRKANSSLARMFGRQETDLVGIRCCELYHGSKQPQPNCTIMRIVTERMPQRVEIHDRQFGRVLRVITDPIISEKGRVVGVVCTTRDVTDEKLIERRLVHQERISAIGELAAGIAHEVGTPLNIISANVEFLKLQKLKNSKEELEAISEQTSNITKLIRQLLDFSRDREPELTAINANDLIEKTIGLLSHQLQKANITVKLNLVRYLPVVDGDASQITQVLFNLITNAVQAMENISDRERILRISTDSALMPNESFNRPHIVIKIEDTGIGVDEDALPNVFNPFFTANKEGGTGLGLAISYRIIQKHLGSLALENKKIGVVAQIKLPLSQT